MKKPNSLNPVKKKKMVKSCGWTLTVGPNVVDLFVMLGWAASCYTGPQVFWVRELRLVQLQLALLWLIHKLCLVC